MSSWALNAWLCSRRLFLQLWKSETPPCRELRDKGGAPSRIFLTLGRFAETLGFLGCTLLEQLDHYPVECRDVIGLAAGYELSVANHFLVDPVRARVLQIRLQ